MSKFISHDRIRNGEYYDRPLWAFALKYDNDYYHPDSEVFHLPLSQYMIYKFTGYTLNCYVTPIENGIEGGPITFSTRWRDTSYMFFSEDEKAITKQYKDVLRRVKNGLSKTLDDFIINHAHRMRTLNHELKKWHKV